MATATEPRKTETTEVAAAPTGDRTYRLSLDQYRRMGEAGIITVRDRVVLLDGVLVGKMTKGGPHVTSTILSYKALDQLVAPGWHARQEAPIILVGGPKGHDSAPEPDVSVVRGAVRDYAARTPQPGDVGLVVEVAESSLYEDRAGLARYAWAGIPTVWIVNLISRSVEVYTDPTGSGPDPRYRTARTFDGDSAVPMWLEGREIGQIAVRDLLP